MPLVGHLSEADIAVLWAEVSDGNAYSLSFAFVGDAEVGAVTPASQPFLGPLSFSQYLPSDVAASFSPLRKWSFPD